MADKKCRYCRGRVYRVYGYLYRCNGHKCKNSCRYSALNFHGKLITYAHRISQFRSLLPKFEGIKIEKDAEAYGIYISSPHEFHNFITSAGKWFTAAKICTRQHLDETGLIVYVKSDKDRVEFNNDTRNFMKAIRENSPNLYLSSAVLAE